MVNLHFLSEADKAVSGSKGIDVEINYFEEIRDDDSFERGLKRIDGFLTVLEESLKFVTDFL